MLDELGHYAASSFRTRGKESRLYHKACTREAPSPVSVAYCTAHSFTLAVAKQPEVFAFQSVALPKMSLPLHRQLFARRTSAAFSVTASTVAESSPLLHLWSSTVTTIRRPMSACTKGHTVCPSFPREPWSNLLRARSLGPGR